MALLKKGVYSSVILPDEDKHTKKCICRIWHLGKLPGKKCTTVNNSFFLPTFVWKSKLCEAQWTNGKEYFLQCLCESVFIVSFLFNQTAIIQNIYISNGKLTVCRETNQWFHQFPIFSLCQLLSGSNLTEQKIYRRLP